MQYNRYEVCSFLKYNYYLNVVGEGLPRKCLILKQGPYLRLETRAPQCALLEGRCEGFLSIPNNQHSKCPISICPTKGSYTLLPLLLGATLPHLHTLRPGYFILFYS